MLLERMFDDLNPEQRTAATHGDGPLLIVAGAGTGKTTTLAARVAFLIERGSRPERLLLLTFSRRASREMLSRAEHMTGARETGRVWAARSTPSRTVCSDSTAARWACPPTSRCWTKPTPPTS